MEYITRSNCAVTGHNDLEEIVVLKNFPVFIGCTDEDEKKDLKADMKWMISKKSGVIQLGKMLPLDVIYRGYHSEAVGKVWKDHRIRFAEFIRRNKRRGDVIEMGGVMDY